MSKSQIEIDLPIGCELDQVVDQATYMVGEMDHYSRLIITLIVDVKKTWEWPSWLLYHWLAENENGTIALGYGEPLMVESKWVVKVADNDMAPFRFSYVYRSDYNFNLPPCTDWKKSLRLNPNRRSIS